MHAKAFIVSSLVSSYCIFSQYGDHLVFSPTNGITSFSHSNTRVLKHACESINGLFFGVQSLHLFEDGEHLVFSPPKCIGTFSLKKLWVFSTFLDDFSSVV